MKKIFAIIEWEDSCEPSVDTTSNPETLPALRVFSSGYVISDDKKGMVIARDYFPAVNDENEEYIETVRRRLMIPRSAIRSVLKIKRNV
jgi:hypothetical protein